MSDAQNRIEVHRQCLSNIRRLKDSGLTSEKILLGLYANLAAALHHWTEDDVKAFNKERERIGKGLMIIT